MRGEDGIDLQAPILRYRGTLQVLTVLTSLGLVIFLVGSAMAKPVPIDVPPASECRVSPKSIEELARLGAPGAPTAVFGMPAATPATAPGRFTSSTTVAGFPRVADVNTSAAIVSVIREYMACINAGAPLRSFALISDEFARRVLFPFGPAELTEDDVAAISAVNPLPSEQLEGLRGIGEVMLVDEKTAHVEVVAGKVRTLEDEPEHEPWLFILVKVGDHWLIENYGLPG